jgi:hypothetical protein
MRDPLSNDILVTKKGMGIGLFQPGDVKDYVLQDIQKTIAAPACIYESNTEDNTRYYFQYLRATVFMCIVKQRDNQWYLSDTLFNPSKSETEKILALDKLIYAR